LQTPMEILHTIIDVNSAYCNECHLVYFDHQKWKSMKRNYEITCPFDENLTDLLQNDMSLGAAILNSHIHNVSRKNKWHCRSMLTIDLSSQFGKQQGRSLCWIRYFIYYVKWGCNFQLDEMSLTSSFVSNSILILFLSCLFYLFTLCDCMYMAGMNVCLQYVCLLLLYVHGNSLMMFSNSQLFNHLHLFAHSNHPFNSSFIVINDILYFLPGCKYQYLYIYIGEACSCREYHSCLRN